MPEATLTDLESVKNDITEEIKSSSDSIEADVALFGAGGAARAAALYTAAAGQANGRLKPLAVALEFLQLGALKHFGPGRPADGFGSAAANLSLITADYYYARALGLVTAMGDDRLVETLCDALAEVSEGYAWPDRPGAAAKRDAFTTAAERLGAYLSKEDAK